jgi:hypothetical protein
MIKIKKHLIEFVTLLLFAASMGLNVSCEKGTDPPRCGSGSVTWDSKAGQCRDREDGTILPNSCCGR